MKNINDWLNTRTRSKTRSKKNIQSRKFYAITDTFQIKLALYVWWKWVTSYLNRDLDLSQGLNYHLILIRVCVVHLDTTRQQDHFKTKYWSEYFTLGLLVIPNNFRSDLEFHCSNSISLLGYLWNCWNMFKYLAL